MLIYLVLGRYGWKDSRAYLETKFEEMTKTFEGSVQIGKEEPRVSMEGVGWLTQADACKLA